MTLDDFHLQMAAIESDLQRLQDDWEVDIRRWRQVMQAEREKVTACEKELANVLQQLNTAGESGSGDHNRGVELFLFCSKRLAERLQYFVQTAALTFAKYTWLNLLKIHHRKTRRGLEDGLLAEQHLIQIMKQRKVEDEKRASILRETQTARNKVTLARQKYLALQITKENHRAYNSLQLPFAIDGMEARHHPLMKSFDRFLKGLLLPVVYPTEFQQLRYALNSYVKLSRAFLDVCRDEAIANHREVLDYWAKLQEKSDLGQVDKSRLREQLEHSKLDFHLRQGKLFTLPFDSALRGLRERKLPIPKPVSTQQVS